MDDPLVQGHVSNVDEFYRSLEKRGDLGAYPEEVKNLLGILTGGSGTLGRLRGALESGVALPALGLLSARQYFGGRERH